ncbi:MAG: SusC/RagA family TonB-linked outer membrane protein [Bacteroidia bacterium]
MRRNNYYSLLLMLLLCLFGFSNNVSTVSATPTPPAEEALLASVSGTVRASDTNEPLTGATVSIQGTTRGILTDESGKFSLEVENPADAILMVSYIGYKRVQVPVNGQTSIEVTMDPDYAQLEEVVVTGYGSQKKENLTGAVGVVSADAIEARPITNASQALQGQVSGVWINQNSGEPGQDGATIRIRGVGTLNDPNPLILVDGIEAPFGNIDPNDIESITVLKDAASAAIYGSRAANGVVLVTTKRGNRNEKPQISYSGYGGVTQVNNIPDYVWNSQQFMQLRNEADANSGNPALYPADIVAKFSDGNNPNYNTNWYDAVFRDAPIQQHNVSVRGGSATTNFNLSVGYLNQGSVVDFTEGSQRYNVRLNIDTKVAEKFTVGTSIYVSRQESNLDAVEQDGGILARATRLGPNFPAYDSQGRIADRGRDINDIELSTPNILAEIQAFNRRLIDSRMLGNLYAEYEIIDGLKLRATFAANYQTDDDTYFNKSVPTYDWETGDRGLIWVENRSLRNEYQESLNLTSWLQATYEKTFGANAITVIGGINQESSDTRFYGASRIQLPSNSLPALITGNPETSTNYGGQTQWALRSFFGRVSYAHADKYLFEFNIRRDGSSRFGANNRWATFPSFSAGWVISREEFMKNIAAIDFLKIRASWGQLGNQNIGNYPSKAVISFAPAYSFGGAIVGAAAQTSLGNPDLRWETTTQTDIGINLALFEGRISIEADFFNRIADDILFDQINPGVTGVRTPTTVNIAKVQNRGWELGLNLSQNIGDLRIRIGGNVTNVQSEVLQIDPTLTGEADRVLQGSFIIQRGSPVNALYGLDAISIFQSQEEIDGAPDQSAFGTPTPGDLRYADQNGDGVITIDDRMVLGQDNPTWLYGANLNLDYKGFDLSALFQGIADAQTFETSRFYAPFANSGGVATIWEDRWTPENPDATLPKIRIGQSGINYNVAHDWWMTERDYFRLKNVQLGYNFPAAMFENNFIRSVRVFVNGTNLWTKTNYIGFDPERAERNTNGGSGYPQLRIFTAGINFKF